METPSGRGRMRRSADILGAKGGSFAGLMTQEGWHEETEDDGGLGGTCEQRKRVRNPTGLNSREVGGVPWVRRKSREGLLQELVKGPRWGSGISGRRGPAGNFRSRTTKGGAALQQQSAAGLDSGLQKSGHLFLARPGLGCALSSLVIQQTLAARLLFGGARYGGA